VLCSAFLFVAGAAPAHATSVTATYSGILDTAYAYNPGSGDFEEFMPGGSEFTLSFTFDPDTPGAHRTTGSHDDQVDGGAISFMPDPLSAAVLTIGSFTYSFDGNDFGYAYTQQGSDGLTSGQASHIARDFVNVNGRYRYSEVIASVTSLLHGGAYPRLLDQPVTILADVMDPVNTATFSINECDYVAYACDQVDATHYKYIYGALVITKYQLSNSRPSAVPLPAALPLLCVALAGLGLYGMSRPKPGVAE
jgi:hypothetical protein